jgi:hypothetical protein
VQQVIDLLSSPEHRLLVTSEVVSKASQSERMAIVDVAHEALIRHWGLLRQWIEANRDLLRQQRKIEASADEWRSQGKKSGYLLQGLPLTEAKLFSKEQRDTFPLSELAKTLIQTSVRQQHWNRIKTASWLIIPALAIGVVIEYQIREQGITNDYARLNDTGYEESRAVQNLVRGCDAPDWLRPYVAERVFGNCRSLSFIIWSTLSKRQPHLRQPPRRQPPRRRPHLRRSSSGKP